MNRLKEFFIQATTEYNTFEKPVPAYYFRKVYLSDDKRNVLVRIAVCGF